MVVIVTRDVADRFRGFLGSCMLELAPGVYTAPRMNPGVRDRVWAVLSDWFGQQRKGCVVMTWRDPALASGQGVLCLGSPPIDIIDADGVLLAARPVSSTNSTPL